MAAYEELTTAFLRVYRFEHLQAITMCDHSTYMPPGGSDARSAALGELAALIHRLRTARTQRPANDWAGFVPSLREVVRLTRERAALLSARLGISKYDALMDRFEPGMRKLGGIFDWLRVNIWEAASRYETDELTRRASGAVLDSQHLRAHLEARYLKS